MGALIRTFRGYVNTWECDDMGHMNVQFHVGKTAEAASHLGNALGLGPSAVRERRLGVIALSNHTNFRRELRVSDGLDIASGVVALKTKTGEFIHVLRNAATGEITGTAHAVVGLMDLEARRLVPWPEDVLERAVALTVPLPEEARARSAGTGTPLPDLTLTNADRWGLIESGRSAVNPWECDTMGHMNVRFYMGRLSDGAGHFWAALGMGRDRMMGRGIGSAVLEYHMTFRREVMAGALLVVRSAVRAVGRKTVGFAHWIIDAETGLTAATAEGTATLMDLEARKATELDPADRARIQAMIRDPATLAG